jgi:hypothetical protein
MPSVGRPLAHALPPPVHDLDAESGIAILTCAHALSSRRTRRPAQHQSPNNVPPLPSTLAHLNLLAVSRKCGMTTENVRLAVGAARTQTL